MWKIFNKLGQIFLWTHRFPYKLQLPSLLLDSFLWRSPGLIAGPSCLGFPLGFLVILRRVDLTPLSLSLRVAIKKFSELKDGVLHRHPSISSLPNQNALMSGSQSACWFLHRRKSCFSCSKPRNLKRDTPPNSPPSSSKTIPKKGCYKVLCQSWIPISFSTHHLHHPPTSLSSNCFQPHLLTHPFFFWKGHVYAHIALSSDSWVVREKELALSMVMEQAVITLWIWS